MASWWRRENGRELLAVSAACLGTLLAYIGLAIVEYWFLAHELPASDSQGLWLGLFLLARVLLSLTVAFLLVGPLSAPVRLAKRAAVFTVIFLVALELSFLALLVNSE